MGELSPKSAAILSTVHPDMQRVVHACAEKYPLQMVVMQGLRTAEEEMAIWLTCHNRDGSRNGQPWKTNCNGYPPGTVAPNGVAGTGVSNHQSGHAVDIGVEVVTSSIVDGVEEVNKAMAWDLPHYQQLNSMMQAAAAGLNIAVTWGGTFHTPDNDHWELVSAFYPV